MLKKCVINNINNEVIFIGDWDFGEIESNGNTVITTPLPDNHTYGVFDITYNEFTKKWNIKGELSTEDRIRQLEDLVLYLLGESSR